MNEKKKKFFIFDEIGFDEQKWHQILGDNHTGCIKGQAEEGMVAKQSNYTLLSSAILEIIRLHNLRF